MLAGACLELVLAVFAFSSFAVTYEKTVPLCVGIAICLTGFTILRLALQLRGLPVDVAVTTLPLLPGSIGSPVRPPRTIFPPARRIRQAISTSLCGPGRRKDGRKMLMCSRWSAATSRPSIARASSRPVMPFCSFRLISISATIPSRRSTTFPAPIAQILRSTAGATMPKVAFGHPTKWRSRAGARRMNGSSSTTSTPRSCGPFGRAIDRMRPTI